MKGIRRHRNHSPEDARAAIGAARATLRAGRRSAADYARAQGEMVGLVNDSLVSREIRREAAVLADELEAAVLVAAGGRGRRKANPYRHATEVQTLLFDAGAFTVKGARAWARSHGFRYGKVDEGGPSARYIRLRQHDPAEYRPGTLRTIALDGDARTLLAVVGVPLRAVAATRPAGYDSRGPRANGKPRVVHLQVEVPSSSHPGYTVFVPACGTRGRTTTTPREDAVTCPKCFAGEKLPRSNPFGKYRGVSYYHTAGVYRAHLPDGTTQVFGAKDGGKRGMQEFIDGYLWAPGEVNAAKNPRRNGRKSAAILAAGKDPSDALEGVIVGSTVEFMSPGDFRGWVAGRVTGFENDEHGLWLNVAGGGSNFTVPHAWVRLPSYGRVLRNNSSSRERVVVLGLGTGTVVARRPGGMVDVRLSSGMVVRKSSSSLRPA